MYIDRCSDVRSCTSIDAQTYVAARKEQGRNIAIHHLHRGVPPLGSGGSGPAARGISVAYPLVKIPAVMFRFAYPEYLWLLWLLPLLVGPYGGRRTARTPAPQPFSAGSNIRPLMPDASTGRRRLKFILYLTAFACSPWRSHGRSWVRNSARWRAGVSR